MCYTHTHTHRALPLHLLQCCISTNHPTTYLLPSLLPWCSQVVLAVVVKEPSGMEQKLHRVVEYQKNESQVLESTREGEREGDVTNVTQGHTPGRVLPIYSPKYFIASPKLSNSGLTSLGMPLLSSATRRCRERSWNISCP